MPFQGTNRQVREWQFSGNDGLKELQLCSASFSGHQAAGFHWNRGLLVFQSYQRGGKVSIEIGQVKMPQSLLLARFQCFSFKIFLNVLDFKPSTSARQIWPRSYWFSTSVLCHLNAEIFIRKSKLQVNISNSSVSTNNSHKSSPSSATSCKRADTQQRFWRDHMTRCVYREAPLAAKSVLPTQGETLGGSGSCPGKRCQGYDPEK